jgi:hypothetical protein
MGGEMSDTPRTNAFEHNMGSVVEPHYVVDVEVAQGLERELAAAIASFSEERERAQREGARVIELQVKLAEAVAAERERCALVCEEFYSVEGVAQKCAEAIRKGE